MNLGDTSSEPCRSPVRRAGRPRNSYAGEAIRKATLEMIAEGKTVDNLSIAAIAARAGVGKPTLYRRWPNKRQLLVDVVASLEQLPPTAISQECVQTDLISVLEDLRLWALEDVTAKATPRLLAEMHCCLDLMHHYVKKIIEPKTNLTKDILQRGIQVGELRADLEIEVALSFLLDPVLVRLLIRPLPPSVDTFVPDLPEELPRRIVDNFLAGARPRHSRYIDGLPPLLDLPREVG